MFTIIGHYDYNESQQQLQQPKPILVNSPTLGNSSSLLHPTATTDGNNKNSYKVYPFDDPQQQQQPSNNNNNMDDYEMKQPIGYGSSAIVYCAIYLPHNKRVAIKVIDLDMFERNQIDELRVSFSLLFLLPI